eukprot:355965-Chlamydomonas_euryale.AAC.7
MKGVDASRGMRHGCRLVWHLDVVDPCRVECGISAGANSSGGGGLIWGLLAEVCREVASSMRLVSCSTPAKFPLNINAGTSKV